MNVFRNESAADSFTRLRCRRASDCVEVPSNENAGVLECQNCQRTCTCITWIPEYEISMCDTCRDEVMLARQKQSGEPVCRARLEIANHCACLDEFRVALRSHSIVCVTCGSGSKTVQSDRLSLNQAIIRREGKVA